MERKTIVRLAVVGSLAFASYLGYRAFNGHQQLPEENTLPNNQEFLSGFDNEELVTETPNLNSESLLPTNSITNTMTGAIYELISDPIGLDRQCVVISDYSNENKQTVTGAAVALGVDPGSYIDIHGGVVYDSNGNEIGHFDRSQLPDSDVFSLILPGTVVCVDE
ncbi:hypothetical protein A2130_04110 [Candidatus Woesebacteria bacterium GWC2_33_12]|uniref:Uncharacterized protein n=1 Tax=Candidatus Woesebacteria bacterium GW2011_GWB1_33_22 TaxID=1618566 RepID=A0A0G0C311_9BACT|nr:MAG: hypothetical protein UR29_C0001G0145 [Candidatus Woesebacteria bacterium GW2011_GWC2_33_12]KKP42645.1 MAG: hypothetical protein UR33_C0001G0006 [Candidatus Woesebacteria bacterium GW2011_GWA2_33_20]KKP45580.1 MAG: hypothetical protein UR35_C0001G0177 [Candidatus Woesebacteria bacterium GW2011_GWB1_33_22]KKP47452.1 MAG: hypothetical protein UR37_C0001G0145 [Microgenomates group bacterium GW2011_GWC1_33_28]KKP51198.1 MAG: hypothetical protein UR41_C0001G0145 [Candidatus Woesebacteria bact